MLFSPECIAELSQYGAESPITGYRRQNARVEGADFMVGQVQHSGSLSLDARFLDDFAPFRHVGFEIGGRVLWGCAQGFDTRPQQLLLDLGALYDLHELAV